jgi:hypothetical protein
MAYSRQGRRRECAGVDPEEQRPVDPVLLSVHAKGSIPSRRGGPATCSGVKPNFFWSAFRGAEAPKVCMPILSPVGPT